MTLQAIGSTNYYPTMPMSSQPTYTPQTVVQQTTDNPLGTDNFSSIGSMLSHAGGGGFASYKLGGQMAQNLKTMFGKTPAAPPPTPGTPGAGIDASFSFRGNFMTGLKGVAMTGLKGAGLSALVSGGVSAVVNGVSVVSGKTDGKTAMNNVVGDTLTGALGGLTAVTLGGVGHIALGAFGVAGLPLTIATVALGAAGGVLGGRMADSLRPGKE